MNTFPVVENVDEAGANFAGVALCTHFERLDAIIKSAGATPLSEFVGFDEGMLEDFGVDTNDTGEEWFSPKEGIRTLEALSKGLPAELASDSDLSKDIKELKSLLHEAHSEGNRWRLEHDI